MNLGGRGTSPAPTVPDEAGKIVRSPDGNATVRGLEYLPGKQQDFQVAKRAFSDSLSKKQVISLLAKNSHRAQKLYHDEGSTPAYNHVSLVVNAAQRQSA